MSDRILTASHGPLSFAVPEWPDFNLSKGRTARRLAVLFGYVFAWMALAAFLPTRPTLAQQILSEVRDAEQDNFFEQHIRPALVKYCYECHAADTEASGGLLLDSAAGWKAGGDSGPAILPGQPLESLFIRAIDYEDSNLQMPPEGKLPEDIIQAFTAWVAQGARDPRQATGSQPTVRTSGLPVEEAQKHWAYRPLVRAKIPASGTERSATAVDSFINRRLAEVQLTPSPTASREVVVRRLYFDLTGLPPPTNAMELWFRPDDRSPEVGYRRLVDGLLTSPNYGEHFARKWMDVARYAESITLRGFVLPEAWRYRDYLIQAYAEDRPFDQMIREQIAGDLLEHSDMRERQMQLTATSLLAMGNNNLEQQDKTQLEMDYIDEQLDTIGRAFLGQTLGCARCHDHKFDPIPTRDYYAMAGILRSAVALEHANLSKWIELPLPLPAEQQTSYDQWSAELQQVDKRLAEIRAKAPATAARPNQFIAIADLPGDVIDDSQARLVGSWKASTYSRPSIGEGYVHDENSRKGMATATFEPNDLAPGQYEIRMAYTASANRSSNTLVHVFSAEGETEIAVNQRQTPDIDGVWISLGTYRVEQDGQAFVLITNQDSNGYVIVDAVQFLPQGVDLASAAPANDSESPAQLSEQTESEQEALAAELRMLESRQRKLKSQLATRPRYLTVDEKSPPKNIPIHIRGDVHNLGEVVPRGFLTALAMPSSTTMISENSSGRLEMANWISSDQNPLTARVYANRVWSWLMGQGLAASLNNFGTTGTAPTHPELLDWLAIELIQSGWSTKHLVRTIVMSQAYRRQVVGGETAEQLDPTNRYYWRGSLRRIPAEALRDAMLQISGELDAERGGSLIRPGTTADYDYQHASTRRSVYHPVFRNSLPELFEVFDFADPSVSIGQRARSTVATQPLALLNHPWMVARAQAATQHFKTLSSPASVEELVENLHLACFFRPPTDEELATCTEFLNAKELPLESANLQLLIHSLFASLDFRYLQ